MGGDNGDDGDHMGTTWGWRVGGVAIWRVGNDLGTFWMMWG